MKTNLEVQLKDDVIVEIEAYIGSPDPKIGISSHYVYEWHITKIIACPDEEGKTEEQKVDALHKWADSSKDRQAAVENNILEAAGY
jgi:hypothetical protein